MRTLLSSRDLISIFEPGGPVSSSQFADWLRKHDGSLVLTGTSVVESSILLLEAGKDEQLRNLLRSVSELPLSYLKEMAIFVEELGGAMVAFGRGREPLRVDPYVNKWSDTLGVSLGKSYASKGLFETTTHLWRTAPEALRHFHRYQEILAEQQASASALTDAGATPQDIVSQQFAPYIERQLKLHGFRPPASGVGGFSAWVYADPLRCPGLRIAFELTQQILAEMSGARPSIPLHGLGHVHATPYVERITIEPPLFEPCKSVCADLERLNPAVALSDRIHPDLQSLMQP